MRKNRNVGNTRSKLLAILFLASTLTLTAMFLTVSALASAPSPVVGENTAIVADMSGIVRLSSPATDTPGESPEGTNDPSATGDPEVTDDPESTEPAPENTEELPEESPVPTEQPEEDDEVIISPLYTEDDEVYTPSTYDEWGWLYWIAAGAVCAAIVAMACRLISKRFK